MDDRPGIIVTLVTPAPPRVCVSMLGVRDPDTLLIGLFRDHAARYDLDLGRLRFSLRGRTLSGSSTVAEAGLRTGLVVDAELVDA